MAKDAKKNKIKKEKKESRPFFKDFKAELKKVTWPTGKQLAAKTTAVIVIVIIVAAIVFALDFAFDKSYEFLITKASNSINKEKDDNQIETTEIPLTTEEAQDTTTENSGDTIEVTPANTAE